MTRDSTHHMQRTAWLSLLAGPVAWSVDESIALVIVGGKCGGAGGLGAASSMACVVVALVALGIVAFAAWSANGLRQRLEDAGSERSLVAERTQFMAKAALIVSALTGFGILLRLVSTLTGLSCP